MPSRPRPHRTRKRPAGMPPRMAELVIEQIGARGDGIARLDGEAVFVPGTVAGDRVLARIEGKRGDGLGAALVEVLVPGESRVAPPCPHYGRCGGCTLQHVSDGAYEEWKRGLLLAALHRARLTAEVEPLIRVPPGSRRRATFAFTRRMGQVLAGFNARASHQVVDIGHCLLLEPPLPLLLPGLRALLAALAPESGGDIAVTLTETGLDVLIEAEARLDLFERERLATFAEAADLARLSWRRPDSGPPEPIARRRAPLVRFGGVAVEPPPGAFLQPTRGGELAIAEKVAAAVGDAAPVADLFAGCGAFALPLAAAGLAVHAVDGEEAPVRAMDAAARRAGLSVGTEVRDLARRPLLADELKRFKAVVFDPPRAGAAAQAEQIAAAGPPLVVAVSCNPATLARDLRILVDGGYRLESVAPIDQFPFAAHLEAVAVLRR